MKHTFFMNAYHTISNKTIDIKTIHEIISENKKLKLSDESKEKISACRDYLDKKMEDSDAPVYGINTGFGSLCNVKVSKAQLTKLQENLVMSHACGTGDKVPLEIVKLMLLLKIQSLSYGHSGVALETVSRLIDFYNESIYPVVYTQGSLGASGDLAPLAHLVLPLLGRGEVVYNNAVITAEELNKKFGWDVIELQSKEGLALLNGTQFMSAYGIYALLKSYKLSYVSDLVAALSIEAFNSRLEPFKELIHLIRSHKGQLKTAARIRGFVEGSEIAESYKEHVQDPYSFRCIPQVHGATKDTIAFVTNTFLTEINSVTDNPLVFPLEDEIISGGHFHGQPLALALDYLKIAMAELGNISERRTYKLISGERGLPAFLVNDPGINSGFMIPQYTAASIVSANKQLATPASVDSIISSNGQEDHVSMGANAATQLFRLVNNLERILAIELLNASQAMAFQNKNTSEFLGLFLKSFRTVCPFMEEDDVLHDYIENAILFVRSLDIDREELF